MVRVSWNYRWQLKKVSQWVSTGVNMKMIMIDNNALLSTRLIILRTYHSFRWIKWWGYFDRYSNAVDDESTPCHGVNEKNSPPIYLEPILMVHNLKLWALGYWSGIKVNQNFFLIQSGSSWLLCRSSFPDSFDVLTHRRVNRTYQGSSSQWKLPQSR